MKWLVVIPIVALLSAAPLDAQPADALPAAPALSVGDRAPTMQIMAWVKGEPIESFQPGRVYVLEFWATWCGPCIAGIPHLTELQRRFSEHADFVGVTTWDQNNSLDIVRAFVESKGDIMGYRVAFDRGDDTWEAYMIAAGQGGIPCAFVIDKQGRIAWIGHPADPDFERTIAGIIADEFDIEAAARAWRDQAAREAIDANARAEAEAKAATLQAELHAAWAGGRQEQAIALADRIVAIDPARMSRWALWKFEALLIGMDEPARAYAYAKSLLEGVYRDDETTLSRLSYGIADSLGVRERDMDLALALAKRCVELTDSQDSRMLAGLAMVHMRRKEYDLGIAAQQRAADVAGSAALRQQLLNDLDFYKLDKEFDSGGG